MGRLGLRAGERDRQTQVFNGTKMYYESGDLKRLGINGTVQARVSDNLTMTWDGFYSNFKDHINQRGFEFPGNGTFPLSNITELGGLVTAGTFSNVVGIVENYASDRDPNSTRRAGTRLTMATTAGRALRTLAGRGPTVPTTSCRPLPARAARAAGQRTRLTSIGRTPVRPSPITSIISDPSLIMLTDTQGWGLVQRTDRPGWL